MYHLNSEKLTSWLELTSPQPVVYPDVASEVAKWIVSGQTKSLHTLSEELWQQTQFPEHVNQRIKQLGFAIN